MPAAQLSAHPKVRANTGKVAVQRGPFVYCIEEADNGPDLHLISFTEQTTFTAKKADWLVTPVLEANCRRMEIDKNWENTLYAANSKPSYVDVTCTLIPYFAWANRGAGEMRVWIDKR